MATVTTVDGYRVFAGTLAECAAFVAAWAIVSATPVRLKGGTHVNHVRWIDEDADDKRTTEYFEVMVETSFGWKQAATFETREAAEAFADA